MPTTSPVRPRRMLILRRRPAELGLGLLLVGAGVGHSAIADAPSLAVVGERTPQGAKLALRGAGWPARVSVALTASVPPAGSAPLDFGTTMTNASGEFRATKLSPCTTPDSAAAQRATVTFTARSADGALSADTKIVALPWACLPR
jgi:hypothetical protein